MTERTHKLPGLATVACACLLAADVVPAQTDTGEESPTARQFTVEVIIFRYADSVSAGSEIFVPDALPEAHEAEPGVESDEVRVFGDATTAGGEAVPLDANGNPVQLDADGNPIELDADGNPIVEIPPRADYVLLLDDELTMLSTWDRLDRLDAYEPLVHFGWHQQVKAFDEPVGIPFADFGNPVAGLDGLFTLYLSRFLHLAVALELNANPNAREAEAPSTPVYSDGRYLEPLAVDRYGMLEGPTFYRIDEDRIFKSGDLRYFDHPRFGVIARIDRIERPENDEPVEAGGAASPSR